MVYYHMSGAGNDFVVLDARNLDFDLQGLAVRLCRKTGADGFLALDHSSCGDFRLHFYNSDGLRGEMCGNGARCICRFAREIGLCQDKMTVQTDAGLVYGWYLGDDQYRVQLNLPSILDFQRAFPAIYAELGNPGIPHALLETPKKLEKESLLSDALSLRHHSAFPKGANVSFFTAPENGAVQVLTYERGVEDYTLSCGTGCGSIACALYMQGRLPGKTLLCHNPGGDLKLCLQADNHTITALYLEGPATILNIYEM